MRKPEIIFKDKNFEMNFRNPKEKSIKDLLSFGLVIIDKPSGPISHQISSFVKEILNVDKAGHSGTLDPAVSGVLPIGINKATKLMKYLLTGGKEYVGVMHIHGDVSENEIKNAKEKFIGKIKQLPPVRSAVKRQLREREVYSFDLLEIDGRDVLFRTSVQAGTYIRKLCYDLGKELGVGANMYQLRRTRVGEFTEEKAVTLYELKDAYYFWKEKNNETLLRKAIFPGEVIVEHMPKIWIKNSACYFIAHGGDLFIPGVICYTDNIEIGKDVILMNKDNEIIGIGSATMDSETIKRSNRGVVEKTKRVIIDESKCNRED